MKQFTTEKGLKILGVGVGAVLLAVCGGGCGGSEPKEGTLGAALEEVTGAHTRVVWMWHQAKKKDGSIRNDTYGNGESHFLMGFDSRDGLGVRELIGEKGNWARPMLSPDGTTLVYTVKNVIRKKGEKHFDPVIFALPWGAPLEEARKIGAGHAVDVWADPEDGVVYVYAIDNLQPTLHAAVGGKRMQRYRLDGTGDREILFEEDIALDNFQLDRSGRRAAGQFPWPDGGLVDMATGEWTKRAQGCWTSIAPDDSGVMWVFDGPHRNARMFGPHGEKTWKVSLDSHPDFNDLEVYHPRWSNHAKVIAVTGPYGSKETGGNQISSGGNEADIFVGRFSDDLRKVKKWCRLTDNDTGDYYPDVWVDEGETESINLAKLGISKTEGAVAPAEGEDAEVVFRWRNGDGDNKVGMRRVTLAPEGIARLGFQFQMLLDGGRFVVDEASAEAVAAAVAGEGTWSLGFWLEENGVPSESALLVDLPGTPVLRTPGGIRYGANEIPLATGGGHDIGFTVRDGTLERAEVDGQEVEIVAAGDPTNREGSGTMAFGSEQDWPENYRAEISVIVLNSGDTIARPETVDEPVPPQIRLRAKLLEMQPTPTPAERDTYVRSLVHYTYAVEEVLEGELDDREIAVWHWVVLDDKETSGLPDTLGEVYELTIEPAEPPYHRELEGELSTQAFTDIYLDTRVPEL